MRASALLSVALLQLLPPCTVMAREVTVCDLIPGDVAAVVRLQTPGQTIDALANLADKVHPGSGGTVRAQATLLGTVISNPAFAGVDRSQDWYVALFAESPTSLETILLIPATDASAVRQAVGGDFHFAEHGNWVAYSKQARLIEQTTACWAGKLAPLSADMDEHVRHQLHAGQLTLFVNSTSLQKTFATPLAKAEQQLDQLIDRLAEQVLADNSELDLQYIIDVYRTLGRTAIQSMRDSKAACISLQIDTNFVQLEQLYTVTADSPSDQFLRTQQVSDMSRLKSVPQGLSAYWAISGNLKPIISWAATVVKAGIKDQDIQQTFMKSFDMIREASIGTVAGGAAINANDDVAIRYYGLTEVQSASKLREAFLQLGSAREYEIAGIKQTQTMEPDAETIDGQLIDLFHFRQTIPPALDPTGIQNAVHDRLYGPDGITQRLAFKDDLLLQTMGGGQDAMKQLLAATTWSDSRLLQSRERQHQQANIMLLMDLPDITLEFAKLVIGTGSLPLPIQTEQLEPLQIDPSYAGFSAAVGSHRLHLRTTLPVETFQGFARLATFVTGLRSEAR